jgi:hypothetical protein
MEEEKALHRVECVVDSVTSRSWVHTYASWTFQGLLLIVARTTAGKSFTPDALAAGDCACVVDEGSGVSAVWVATPLSVNIAALFVRSSFKAVGLRSPRPTSRARTVLACDVAIDLILSRQIKFTVSSNRPPAPPPRSEEKKSAFAVLMTNNTLRRFPDRVTGQASHSR